MGFFSVIKAKSVVINETLNNSTFIINIFGTPKDIMTTDVGWLVVLGLTAV